VQITKELLDNEIATLQFRIKETEASVNKFAGALVVLQDLRRYLDRDEEKEKAEVEAQAEAARDFISEENAAIQKRDEEQALSMKQFAEIVAGPDATAEIVDEEPQPYYDGYDDDYANDYDGELNASR